ncbi:Postreplication repair E3 ubiquitin-protein ligase rad18 [Lasiodiplodia hormozganensis]|uniref:Postreplication repair E3 ubiquitin-protein ligase RAD18 n=1 Tax=Lasiodiplodia hormozganensis TaxID=869390 RepID=A0AA39Z0K3_9PEZI|nr:Postreplication repair E3 ubiquitin-protein ligase rad18 [Lasiodiplodia hormozganensis]
MDAKAFTIADSTDWLGTALADFAPLESALRCQVCKDFFDTPMMTSCSHTFCSLCIRRCFAADGRCPTCRAADQDSKLRRNWTAQELVDTFQRARPSALELARRGVAETSPESGPGTKKARGRGSEKKRKLDEIQDSEDGGDQSEEEAERRPVRKTRTQPRRSATSSRTPEIIDLEDDGDGDFVAEEEDEEAQPNDGLVACPMCNKRMKEEAVFSHLDRCDGPDKDDAYSRATRTRQNKTAASTHPLQRSRNSLALSRNTEPLQRLPQLNYSLLKDTALRKKLSELGIPSTGTRPQQIKRHTEWVNLWNANVDSLRPRTKKELLSDLDKWERSQSLESGGIIGSTSGSQVMKKDFDGDGWAKNNKSHFDELIAAARSKRAAPKVEGGNSEEKTEEATSSEMNGAMPPASVENLEEGKEAHPYEDNEGAIEKVRDRVDDAASGRPSLPHRNSNTMEDANSTTTAADHTQAPTSSSQATGSPSKSASADREKVPSSLPAHLASSKDVRKRPMFEIPSEPIIDVDTEHGR